MTEFHERNNFCVDNKTTKLNLFRSYQSECLCYVPRIYIQQFQVKKKHKKIFMKFFYCSKVCVKLKNVHRNKKIFIACLCLD